MAQDTNVENLIINKLTKAQYESIANPDPTQLYFITDEVISSADVINALGYTPYNATNPNGYISSASISSLTDVNLTGLVDGQVLKYNSTAQKWENSTVDTATWGNITGTLSDQTDLQTALDAKQNTILDLSTIRSGASLGATALQPNDNITELVNNAGYITGITSSDVTTALGYTPYNSTNPSGYITSSDLPTVNNGTLTIQKNGTTVGTFTANQSTNSTINIEADTVLTDDTTVNKNSDDELQTIGVIDDNVQNAYNFTVVGSPTITDDGIASGFTTSNYITVTKNIDFTKPFVIEGEFTTGSNITQQQFIFATTINNAFGLQVFTDGYLYVYYPTTTNSYKKTILLSANTKYKYRYYYTGTELKLDINNETYTISTSDFNPTIASFINIGIGRTGAQPFIGSIDLKQFSITVDGVEVYKAWQPPAIKYWIGTKAQYDAIATKDANTLYNITDDSNPTLSMLELLYPIGSIYIGTMSACPLQTLGVGTWQLVATDRVLQGAGTRGSVGTTIDESLPNIKGQTGGGFRNYGNANWGALYGEYTYNTAPVDGNYTGLTNLKFDASRSSSTYQDNAPVQQDAYLVNIWERIS